jgi:arylsulfatase A-like enzyme
MEVAPRSLEAPINTPDIMPTILSLAGVKVPESVEGDDFSGVIRGTRALDDHHALITCPSPFGQWTRQDGGREYLGVRTKRYTYTRTLKGPWELFDNEADPFQMTNLVAEPAHKALRDDLEDRLQAALKQTGDDFAPGPELLKRCGYRVDETETVGYRDPNAWGQISKPARVG